MKAIALVLVLSLVGCASLTIPPGSPGLPQGAELSAFGKASARLTVGPKMTTNLDRDGNRESLMCEEANGQQCIDYAVAGGEFSGWQLFFSVITGAFTIYGVAK